MLHLIGLFFLLAFSAFGQSGMLTYNPVNPGAVPMWIKCTVTNSTTNLVVSGTGCTAASIAKAAGLTQSIPLFPLLAKGFVHDFYIESTTAFVGTTTLLGGLGTTDSPNLFLVSAVTGYNLKTAVSATNHTTLKPLVVGSDTSAATNVVLALTSTVDLLTSISAGVVDVYVLRSVRP